MPSIITDAEKRFIIQHLYDDIADSASTQNYYIGFARSQPYDSADTVVTPTRSTSVERDFRLNLQAIKKTATASFVIPRYNWTSGTIYKGFDDTTVGIPTNSYYVMTDENSVYMCLSQGKDSTGAAVQSTIKPTGSNTKSFRTADGYVWKFLYGITAINSVNFITANYIPVKLQGATTGISPALDIEQEGIQNAAVPGQIANIVVTSGGTGYTSAPTVTVVGDGSGVSATATVSGGAVVKINLVDSSTGEPKHGSGYHYGNVVFTGGGGSGAAARIVLPPNPLGFGADPRVDLKSSAIMYRARVDGAEGNDFLISQDFRQVGLIKNPKTPGGSLYTSSTGSALHKLRLSTVSVAFTADKTILGGTSGARAYVDNFDSDTIYYHQTKETGFTPFQNNETVAETNGSGSGIISASGANLNGDIDIWSGEIQYIENRAAVERTSASAEDIKVIIQI